MNKHETITIYVKGLGMKKRKNTTHGMKKITKQAIIVIVLSILVTLFFQIMSMPLRVVEICTIMLVIIAIIFMVDRIIIIIRKGKTNK